MSAPIYLDYQATTPADSRVVEAMLPYFTGVFGNPHSQGHGFGRAARDAVEAARAEIAALIGASPREIVFTSGATEANNLAVIGLGTATTGLPDASEDANIAVVPSLGVVELALDAETELHARTLSGSATLYIVRKAAG